MKLSTRGRYGTRLMLELAINYGEGPISMSDVSMNQGIPIKYLEQLVIPLKKAEFIVSVRGPKGGHMLAAPPEKINLWDILSLLETNLAVVDCVNDETVCDSVSDCLIRPFWGKAFSAMKTIFEETSLQDILNFSGSSQKK
ncbi:RrF2 family transcriptional regulator [Thermodesulfobacteriota bacterium]